MKHAWTIVAGTALAAGMWVGTAGAGEQFQTLAGVQAAAMSQSEMAAVEGKNHNALGAIAVLGPRGFLAFVNGKRGNPIATYDANALNPDGKGVITAVGVFDPLQGLISFAPGDTNAPLFLIDLTSIFNPPSGQSTFLGLPDFSGILGLLQLSGGGNGGGVLGILNMGGSGGVLGILGGGTGGVLNILSLGGNGGLLAGLPIVGGGGGGSLLAGLPIVGGGGGGSGGVLGILNLGGSGGVLGILGGGTGGVLNILDLGGTGGVLSILDLGGNGGILSILDFGGSSGVLGILGGGKGGGVLNILNLGGSGGGILSILNLGGSGGGVLGALPVGGLLTGLPILSGI